MRVIALMMAVMVTVSATVVLGTGAITVERDGEQYILRSRTPTSGDLNVLVVRVGFADYNVDDEDDPADSEATLLSYFDGSEGSVSGFYEASSYGKLRLHCDKVYTYNAQGDRDDYDNGIYSIDDLLTETLGALGEIDLDDYDSDGDGYLDVVCFDFAGPMGEWSETWWPHVSYTSDLEIGDKRIDAYTLLRGNSNVFTHEFGHIFGAMDYYSATDGHPQVIMTYDMMSDNTGDHDGFTKWSYGWFDDEDIAYVDRAAGDTTVTLTPIESQDSGKKIAVVAPQTDRSNGFLDEYFLVEYDSGTGNNAAVFESKSLEPGFRIFHVDARSRYFKGDPSIYIIKNNEAVRNNLIHNVKNEYEAPDLWYLSDMFYREGDSLTPQGYPNTGLSDDSAHNGTYTGISFTDFVTGDQPSFKVSFSDDPPPEVEVELTLDYEELKADVQMAITSDTTISMRNLSSEEEINTYSPYLEDQNGTKFPLSVKPGDDAFTYQLSYSKATPKIQPNTEYTLVIPKGFFLAGYHQDVDEYSETIKTDNFLPTTVVSMTPGTMGRTMDSNLFALSDDIYGVVSIPSDSALPLTLTEYNLDGEALSKVEFDPEGLDRLENPVYRCTVLKLYSGELGVVINAYQGNYYFKIDRSGKLLSEIFTVDSEVISDLDLSITELEYAPFKSGIFAMLNDGSQNKGVLTIDFEKEPQIEESRMEYGSYTPIDSDTYAIEKRINRSNHLILYNANDDQIADIEIVHSALGIFEDHGNITVLTYEYDRGSEEWIVKADTYSKDGVLLESNDVSDRTRQVREESPYTRYQSAPDGYYFIGKVEDETTVVVCDKEWNYTDTFRFTPLVTYSLIGNCGFIKTPQVIPTVGGVDVLSRFRIGDIRIVPVPGSLILGDANLDAAVDVTDATAVQRYECRMIELSGGAMKTADVDGDGDVCIIDTTWIQRYGAQMDTPYAIGEPI